MACRRLTPEDMLARRIPENAELVYMRDEFDQGGPVIIVYREKDVPSEVIAENRRRLQEVIWRIERRYQRDEALKLAASVGET